MNERQREIQQIQIDSERKALRELKQVYSKAKEDVVERITDLSRRTDLENIQSIVYQKQYQEALKKQIDGVLDKLNGDSFTTVADFLGESYENGFMGTLYDLQGQGIPLIFPMNQAEVHAALQTDSKISNGLYARMGEDTKRLKNSIRAELSRGAANGESWSNVAAHIARGMTSPFDRAYRRTAVIARTEGHRVQQEGQWHCQQRAKSKGADVVKQWDSTLDSLTRPAHVEANGQVAEVDEPFTVMGEQLMYPGDTVGSAANVINCRCCVLQRARWAITDDEFYTKWDGDKDELVKIGGKSYNEFKEEAQKALDIQTQNKQAGKIVEGLQKSGVEYRPVQMHETPLTEDEIIQTLAGGDRTKGSCSSLALSYAGQKAGMDVRDFRGGDSQEYFATSLHVKEITNLPGMNAITETARTQLTAGNKALKHVEVGKEYYFVAGKHAAIVRKTDDGVLQYLELQSENKSGWTRFNGNPRHTLHQRFGCKTSGNRFGLDETSILVDVENMGKSDDFKTILGFLNTAEDQQLKGRGGGIK